MGPSGMQGRSYPGGQKRPGSPPPPPATMANSPPDAKRPRPNDIGPAPLVDSRPGADGRPGSSKGPGQMPYPGGPPMPGQHPGMNGQQNPQLQVRAGILSKGPQPPPFGKNVQPNGYNPGPGPARGPRPSDAPSPAAGDGPPGQPRQLANVKGGMGPPASPSLAHRNVGGVKKSESAGSSPGLPPSAIPNGMDSRSRTPLGQQIVKPPSPAQPMSRPQSAQPQQGPSMSPIPGPPPSAPPMLPSTQSPSNGMMFKDLGFSQGSMGGPGAGLDFGLGSEFFGQLTSGFFPDDDSDQMLTGMEWLNDETSLQTE